MLDFQRFYASLRCGGRGVKQGIRWLGLVFGLMLSKGAKQGCQANKQARVKCWVYGAKQG